MDRTAPGHSTAAALWAAPSPLAVLLLTAFSPFAHAAEPDLNIGRHRFATGTSAVGDAVAQFATDGKVGPENRWLTSNRGRHRLNIFFERNTAIGGLHLYSGGNGDAPVDEFTVQYRNSAGSLVDVPGASVVGNTNGFVSLVFAAPVTTTQMQLSIEDQTATVREVAVFPPGAVPASPGAGVSVHLARQHRLPLVTASSTSSGTSRRSVVDGFVNDTDYWRSNGAANQWIALDLTDPPETNPVSIRAVTSPIEVGSVHLYTGLDSGDPPVSRGRVQSLDAQSGVWVDIPGGTFANNTDRELSIVFDSPVTTAGLRLVIQEGGNTVREIVPLPPNDGQPWPIGQSVTFADATDALEYGDKFFGVTLAGSGLSMTSAAGPDVALRPANSMLTQHYQVLLSVGTDTYRVRNRVTGRCLEPLDGSTDAGAPVVEAEYLGLPTQRWRIEPTGPGLRFVNAGSGLAIAVNAASEGQTLSQQPPGVGQQTWTLDQRANAPKKGNGGFPSMASTFAPTWAYNWGPTDTYPAGVHFWPMQWGSFNWTQRPSLLPEWQRNGEPIVLMGFNEPDKTDQSNMSVATAAAMWPRLEVLGLPLLGPAVAGHPANSTWIQGFMAEVLADEMRVDYVGMHSYGGPNADNFINQINSARNAWGRDVVVSEFSVVDWSNTNSWNDNAVFNFFAEVLWRMDLLPSLHRYAVFVFTDDPSNPISDNRGEMLNADGTLTPEGKLFSAWDEDTTIRTDTPYHIQNTSSFVRVAGVPGVQGEGSTELGDRFDDHQAYRWRLRPGSQPGAFKVECVADGRILAYTSRGLEAVVDGDNSGIAEFELTQIAHGWFAIVEPTLDRRLSSSATQGGAVTLAPPGTATADAQWRLVPVYAGLPGPPRNGVATPIGGGEVLIQWDPHGFRDLIGFTVYRQGPGDPSPLPIAADLAETSWVDSVPAPGTYAYSLSAVGDTGESTLAAIGAVSVETCAPDFNADFVVDETDIEAAIEAIGNGLDYDGNGLADFFDVIDFLRVFDEGCNEG